jgi:hypothetical protein
MRRGIAYVVPARSRGRSHGIVAVSERSTGKGAGATWTWEAGEWRRPTHRKFKKSQIYIGIVAKITKTHFLSMQLASTQHTDARKASRRYKRQYD